MSDDTLMRTLGWASAALGVPQVLPPRAIRASARRGRRAPARGCDHRRRSRTGRSRRPARHGRPAWLWARVGGDLMDLTLLGRALKSRDGRG